MSANAPGWWSTPTSPAPSSPGCWTTCRAPGSAAEHGALAFGTIDSFLLWRLTGGRVHATDATNASRTMLFDIARQAWDPTMLAALRIPESVLPRGPRLLPPSSARPTPTSSAPRSRSWASPATSRRRRWARPASTPAWARAPTAPAASCWSTPASAWSHSEHRLLSTVAYRLGGKVPPTRWRAASSWRVPPCNGCATDCGSSAPPTRARRMPGTSPRPKASTWSRPSPAWVPRTGTRTRAAPSSG